MSSGTDDNQDLLNRIKKMEWFRSPFVLYPKELVHRRMTPNFIGLCISYNNIYQDTKFEKNSKSILYRELKQFDLINVLENLARLNFFLSEYYHIPLTKLELTLAKELVPEKTFHKIENQRKKIFSRQQILALIKTAMLRNHSDRRRGKIVIEDLHTFGRTLFRITDFLDEDTLGRLNRARPKKKKRIATAILVRNFILNSSDYFKPMLTRYWTIYFDCLKRAEVKYPKEYYPVVEKYKKVTGIELEKFMGLVFGIWCHYDTKKKQIVEKPREFWLGPQFFKVLKPQLQQEAKNIFLLLSRKLEEFRICVKKEDPRDRNHYKFKCIWQKPLLNIGDKAFCPLDIGYLQEKMTYGVYWTVFQDLLKKEGQSSGIEKKKLKKDLNRLAGFYGRCLEIYVKDILTRIYIEGKLGRLFLEGVDYQGGADFIISYADLLILIEVTKRNLLMETVWKADMDAIEKEIKDIFFGEVRYRYGKVEQIDKSIRQIRNRKINLPGVEVRKIKKFYPVLITEVGLPNIPPMRDLYLTLISRKGFLKDCAENFQYMDIEELELLEAAIEQGASMPDIFEKKQKGYDSWPMKNFLYSEMGDKLNVSKYLDGQFDKFVKRISVSLFGRS